MAEETMDAGRAERIARQHVQTTRLLGVDFLPRRVEAGAAEMEARPASGRAPEAGAAVAGAGDAGAGAAAVRRDGRSAEERQRSLDELRARHDRECPHCTRATAHTRTVFGEGSAAARLMFIGEAPGEEEDRTGRPFVGRAGQKLNEMITAMGLKREDVYIANVLKSRPPNNATPTRDEAERCGPYLLEQVRIIQPEVIVTLGRPAAQLILGSDDTMTNLRGRWAEYDGTPVMPTFHPAYLLRAYTPENRKKVWSDLQQAMGRLGLSKG